mgnify:CR=1 FL=1
MRMAKMLALVAGVAGAGQALAVNVEGYDIPYVAAQYAHEIADSARNADDGKGYQLTFGVPLSKPLAFELSFYDAGRNRAGDNNDDYQTAVMFDLVRGFNLEGGWRPFALAGLGIVEDDVLGDKDLHYGGNLGVGVLLPSFFNNGWTLRAEARTQIHQNRDSVAGKNSLTDSRIMLGLQIPLSYAFQDRIKAGRDCDVAVVPLSGRRDCGVDSDRDGVSDGFDDCPGTPPGVITGRDGCPLTEGVVLRGVNFKTGSAVLTERSKTILNEVASSLNSRGNSKTQIQISGHTDNVGDAGYNEELSRERAESVRQYLISRGVDDDRMSAEGYGENKPMTSNSRESGRAKNRRVEFRIIVK